MNLDSTQDIILLRNCIVIKINKLKLDMTNPNIDFLATKTALDNYTKLLEHLNNSDSENVINILHNSIQTEDFSQFSKHILSTPSKEIAQEYIDLTEELMKNNNSYSEEKFKELKTAFYKGNEHLNPDNKILDEYEEEPESNQFSTHLTEDMKISLDTLNKLIKQNHSKSMSPTQFKNFVSQFKDIVKLLGISKFQQYFNEKNQTITDMNIFYDTDEYSRTVYKTDFTLADRTSQESHVTLQEPASKSGFISNYYQNLCYSYLEADKYSKIDENALSADTISDKMNTFKECYKKLEEMMSKCKITISNNSLFYLSESEIEPTELDYDLTACNNEIINPTKDDVLEI